MAVTRVGLSGGEVESYGAQMLQRKELIEDEGGTVTKELGQKWARDLSVETKATLSSCQAVVDRFLGTDLPAGRKKRGNRSTVQS